MNRAFPLAGIPPEPVQVPAAVARLARRRSIIPVWRNEVGGLTFRLGDHQYVKWVAPGTPEIDLPAEAERLTWASRWISVPTVVDHGVDVDGAWLLTSTVPGRSAVDPRWLARPHTAATAIGRGLRVLHDALPVTECPFDWSVERRLAGRNTPSASPRRSTASSSATATRVPPTPPR